MWWYVLNIRNKRMSQWKFMAFFQDSWNWIKNDLRKVVDEFYERGVIDAGMGETFRRLIPKKDKAVIVKDFRLNSLVFYQACVKGY